MARERKSAADRLKDRKAKEAAEKATQEQAIIEALENTDKPKKKFPNRVSVDFPPELLEKIREYTGRRGGTLRGFIVNACLEFFDEEEA